ncbi:hypothetical protein [Heterosigma akashiwo virus 01]|uniref:MYM-type domain-containing protein n=1 Tax=Heterosigma akashiwo virus 01 TaxID=97195 RepID=A0A1C9C569_HAV01|nr:hypothetical protein D1R72_gp101 [Heterosigma akashiwo virus 01]AOM63432.1 hypothetical protein [Heterosigma akashiwo virus 01]
MENNSDIHNKDQLSNNVIKKKRGRKKRFEYTDINNNVDNLFQTRDVKQVEDDVRGEIKESENETFKTIEFNNNLEHDFSIENKTYKVSNVSFGNLQITVNSAACTDVKKLSETLFNYDTSCEVFTNNSTYKNIDGLSTREKINDNTIISMFENKHEENVIKTSRKNKQFNDKNKKQDDDTLLCINDTNAYHCENRKKNDFYSNVRNQHGTDYNKGEDKNDTLQYCWWCKFCKIDLQNYRFIPTKYDSKRKIYTKYGFFCSWSCAKAFNFDSSIGTKKIQERNYMILDICKHLYGNNVYRNIKPSPHWSLLKQYGGDLDIREFHQNTSF